MAAEVAVLEVTLQYDVASAALSAIHRRLREHLGNTRGFVRDLDYQLMESLADICQVALAACQCHELADEPHILPMKEMKR